MKEQKNEKKAIISTNPNFDDCSRPGDDRLGADTQNQDDYPDTQDEDDHPNPGKPHHTGYG